MHQITRLSAKLDRPYHSSGGYEQTSHRGTSGSIPDDFMRDLSWNSGTGFLTDSLVLPVKRHSTAVPYSALSSLWVACYEIKIPSRGLSLSETEGKSFRSVCARIVAERSRLPPYSRNFHKISVPCLSRLYWTMLGTQLLQNRYREAWRGSAVESAVRRGEQYSYVINVRRASSGETSSRRHCSVIEWQVEQQKYVNNVTSCK
jgi:hypothetical protein